MYEWRTDDEMMDEEDDNDVNEEVGRLFDINRMNAPLLRNDCNDMESSDDNNDSDGEYDDMPEVITR